MKIIKEGTPRPRADTPQNFKCKQCGCEFVAEKGEYDTYMNFYDFRTELTSYCPNCHGYVSKEAFRTEGDDFMHDMG